MIKKKENEKILQHCLIVYLQSIDWFVCIRISMAFTHIRQKQIERLLVFVDKRAKKRGEREQMVIAILANKGSKFNQSCKLDTDRIYSLICQGAMAIILSTESNGTIEWKALKMEKNVNWFLLLLVHCRLPLTILSGYFIIAILRYEMFVRFIYYSWIFMGSNQFFFVLLLLLFSSFIDIMCNGMVKCFVSFIVISAAEHSGCVYQFY